MLLVYAAAACTKKDEVIVQLPNQYPMTPSYLFPANNASNLPVQFEFTWAACTDPQGDPVSYDVVVASTHDLYSPTAYTYNLTEPKWSSWNFNYGTYYWQVTARDNHNNISQGPVWVFTVGSGK